jgi:hypothetical protein
MLSDWVSFLAYPNLFEIKGFVVVVVLISQKGVRPCCPIIQQVRCRLGAYL